jgi:hypothetical protein
VNIRPSGLTWLRKRGGPIDGRVVVSKYYTEDEAFPHTPVWWFEFLEKRALEEQVLNLLCQVAPTSSEFHHLRVPMSHFLEHKNKLGFRDDKFSLYLSAEKSRLFREIRGNGQIEFRKFKVE